MNAWFTLVGLLTFVCAAVVLYAVWRGLRPLRVPPAAAERLRKQWQAALSMSQPNLQVLEADKTFDHALRSLGYTGSFAEKFRRCSRRFTNAEAVWSAHRLRNRIAHEANVKVSEADRQRAVNAFAAGLRTLGVL